MVAIARQQNIIEVKGVDNASVELNKVSKSLAGLQKQSAKAGRAGKKVADEFGKGFAVGGTGICHSDINGPEHGAGRCETRGYFGWRGHIADAIGHCINFLAQRFQRRFAASHDCHICSTSGQMNSNGGANAAATASDEAMFVRQVHGLAISAALSANRQS